MTKKTPEQKDAAIKARNLKYALYQRMVLDPTNLTKVADYKRGYVIYEGAK